jgi:hypothetical protein
MSTTDFNPPPLFCQRTDILAHSREIRGMAKRPIGRIRAAADCAICSQPIRTGEQARLLPKGVVVHIRCAEELIARLDKAVPKQEPTQPEDLPFDGEPLEVE